MQPCLPGENIAILEVPLNGRGLLLLFKLLLAPTWAPHSAHFSFYEFVAPIYILGSSWGHIGDIFVSPPRQIFLSNLKYVANYMPFALKFLCFFYVVFFSDLCRATMFCSQFPLSMSKREEEGRRRPLITDQTIATDSRGVSVFL